MADAIYTLYIDKGSTLRIRPNKVLVGTHGDGDVGLINKWHLRRIANSDEFRPGTNSELTSLSRIKSYNPSQWNLVVLERLLGEYIQRSRPLVPPRYLKRPLWRRPRHKQRFREHLLGLSCLIQMQISIRQCLYCSLEHCSVANCEEVHSLQHCCLRLKHLKREWALID